MNRPFIYFICYSGFLWVVGIGEFSLPKSQTESNMDDPTEFMSWAFAAGIPDARGEQYGTQAVGNPNCFGAFSQLMWDLGFRHHDDLQTKWVKPGSGPARNFEAWGVTDTKPETLAKILVEVAPDKAAALAEVTPNTHAEALKDAHVTLLANLEKLRAAMPGVAP